MTTSAALKSIASTRQRAALVGRFALPARSKGAVHPKFSTAVSSGSLHPRSFDPDDLGRFDFNPDHCNPDDCSSSGCNRRRCMQAHAVEHGSTTCADRGASDLLAVERARSRARAAAPADALHIAPWSCGCAGFADCRTEIDSCTGSVLCRTQRWAKLAGKVPCGTAAPLQLCVRAIHGPRLRSAFQHLRYVTCLRYVTW